MFFGRFNEFTLYILFYVRKWSKTGTATNGEVKVINSIYKREKKMRHISVILIFFLSCKIQQYFKQHKLLMKF